VNKDLELWQFIADRLQQNQPVMLLVVVESSGSSPGRQGYKMAVAADGELTGSIGGGVMEVNLVEQSRRIVCDTEQPVPPAEAGEDLIADLSVPPAVAGGLTSFLKTQVHQKHSANSSGMICSGRQTVIFRRLDPADLATVNCVIQSLKTLERKTLSITNNTFQLEVNTADTDFEFEKRSDTEFAFRERLGHKNDLYIIGGGHCALALSELMSRMDFYIRLYDDRPELNTLDKNRFAHEKHVIESYENVGAAILSGPTVYVVVMTLGYRSDEIAIRQLIDKDFKYFGVLGSKAKMATLLRELKQEGLDARRLDKIHTPIGLPINSHTPEEIAVSIAAEIIKVKNS
jgi:xanthine dehydrogenase accessory factor